MDQSIADALRRIYDATDPNHTYNDEYFQKVAEKYKGREVEMFRTLYDSIDPNHGYNDEYFQKVVDKYTQTDKKKDVPVVDFTKPITAAKKVLGEGDSADVTELAKKYGFSKLTEQSIEQTADSIVRAIRNGEVDPTAFGSGWNQVKSGMYAMASDAILNAPTIRPTAVPGVMMPSISEEAQQRQARQDIKRLQASGYFEDGGLLEKALIEQLTSSKKMEEALKAKGLDPEKTLYDAASSGNAAEFFQRLSMSVAQQAPQLLTQVALSAIPVIGQTAGPTFMASQVGGSRLVQALLEDQKLTADDRRAAVGAAVLEFLTERIMSPVGKLGGRLIDVLRKQGKGVIEEAAEDIIRQGNFKMIIDFSKKLITDAGQEGTEELFVEVLSPLNEALVKQLSKENPYFDAKAYLKEQYGEDFGKAI